MGDRSGVIPLDVGQDAQVLLHPAPEPGQVAGQCKRLVEPSAGGFHRSRLEIEPGEHVERLTREHRVAGRPGQLVAAAAEVPGALALVPVVQDDREAPAGLRLGARVAFRGRELPSHAVPVGRLGHAAGPLVGDRLRQKLSRPARPRVGARPSGGRRVKRVRQAYQATAYLEKCRIDAETVRVRRSSMDGSSSRMPSSSLVYTTRLSSSSGEQLL